MYVHKDGTKYIGEWKNSKQHGYGEEYWTDGTSYKGTYFDGKM